MQHHVIVISMPKREFPMSSRLGVFKMEQTLLGTGCMWNPSRFSLPAALYHQHTRGTDDFYFPSENVQLRTVSNNFLVDTPLSLHLVKVN